MTQKTQRESRRLLFVQSLNLRMLPKENLLSWSILKVKASWIKTGGVALKNPKKNPCQLWGLTGKT
jgi:hypothetical protein